MSVATGKKSGHRNLKAWEFVSAEVLHGGWALSEVENE
jgi:hypothetical protein